MKILAAFTFGLAGLAGVSLIPANATVTIDWAVIGDVGNPPDPVTGFGAVSYEYKISKYEVTNAQYCEFLNAVDPEGTNPHGVFSTSMQSDARGGITFAASAATGAKYSVKTNMGHKPVNYVSWFDGVRFANWLNNGQGGASTESGAYTLDGENGYPTRNLSARIWMTSENEWYKAAYYDPTPGAGGGDNYWSFATTSNAYPVVAVANATGEVSNPGPRVANYNRGADWNSQDGNLTTVGSAGAANHYGTFDQDGNLWEWSDTLIGTYRGIRGGCWFNTGNNLQSTVRHTNVPQTLENDNMGIRLATHVNFSGTDDFNDNAKNGSLWGADTVQNGVPPNSGGNPNLTETNGRMEYTETTGAPVGVYSAERPWIKNAGSYVDGWDIRMDLHLAATTAMPDSGDQAAVGMRVYSPHHSADFRFEQFNVGGTIYRGLHASNDGPGARGARHSISGTEVSLRMSFDPATKTLSCYFDENGAANGYAWTRLHDIDMDDNVTDWELHEGNFLTSVYGQSSGVAITSGDAIMDNFSASQWSLASEISVTQAGGGTLESGATVALGTGAVEGRVEKLITIRNLGEASLTGLSASIIGGNATDFNAVGLTTSSLAPGDQTVFSVHFEPSSAGNKSAVLRIASNDANENPFDLTLTGTAVEVSTENDTDGDGLSDAFEAAMFLYGFDWQVAQPEMAASLFSHADDAGLFTRDQVQAMNVATPLLERNLATGHFRLNVAMKKSIDLLHFEPFEISGSDVTTTPEGEIQIDFTVPDRAAFFRLECK